MQRRFWQHRFQIWSTHSLIAVTTLGLVAAACSASKKSAFGAGGPGDSGSGAASAASGAGGVMKGAGGTTTSGIDLTTSGNGGATSGGNECASGENDDNDKDGFTPKQGDCNDCDKNVNPNAVEVIGGMSGSGGGGTGGGMPADENCDGKVDELPTPCDKGLNVASTDAFDEAKAIGLCKKSKGALWPSGPVDWGVVTAQWTSLDQSAPPANPKYALGHGIVTAFGKNVKVQEGSAMMVISSGTARQPTDPGYSSVGGFDKQITMPFPKGKFPKESPSCPGVTTGAAHDGAATVLKIRVPSNAHGFKFNFNFYTFEWPGFVCSTFNDFFVAMLDPIPMGLIDGNIVFDKQKNPVSVNNAFLEVCGCSNGPPCQAGGKNFTCALGDTTLLGTGFGKDGPMPNMPNQFGQDHGSTMWLETQAPVEPNKEMTIEFAAWDSGDGILDSTALIDNFTWIAKSGTTVGTNTVPNPK